MVISRCRTEIHVSETSPAGVEENLEDADCWYSGGFLLGGEGQSTICRCRIEVHDFPASVC